ncbi:MAG TPA: ABC transporter permease [Candidatus Acidoferrum sp.]|nr:ABC transporter permease [Candidatus Acidoferrum sp.]
MMAQDRLKPLRSIFSSKSGTFGSIIILTLFGTALAVAIFGKSLVPYDPIQQDVGPILGAPSMAHLFGTDQLGRDVFSRVVYASVNDAYVSVVVIGASLVIGALIGSYAGFRGGKIDDVLMRITDSFFALPSLLLAMAIAVALGPGVIHMMYALIVVWWPSYARMFRAEALRISRLGFVEASKACGTRTWRILARHVVPNSLTTMILYATLDIGTVIIVYSGLSYLGLSVAPPSPDWGEMVAEYQSFMVTAPWLPIFPGLVIALMVIGFSLFGDGLRDILESTR